MKSIYSIVHTPIHSISHERLNLGMLMLNESGMVSFKYSEDKLKKARPLFSVKGYKLVKSYLSSIEKRLGDKGDLINNLAEFKTNYLSYLSSYSNNLISFTKPQIIDLELNEGNFKKLFEKFVYKMPQALSSVLDNEPSLISKAKEFLVPKVRDRVNIDVELSPEKYNFVLFNLHVDMIGKNDRPVLNQFIDFQSTPGSLQKNITNYISLIKPFEIQYGHTGKFFLVGDEPLKELQNQHLIWKHLMDSPLLRADLLEVVPSSEVNRVEEYLHNHDVQPYFKEG